jgi:RimJ/RimL family protein N-acetyltransferase
VGDAPIVERLAGDRDVASTTRLIPHPYPPGMAEQWLAALPEHYQRAEAINWGITLDGGPILGTIRLVLNAADNHAEMGYWVGKPFWKQRLLHGGGADGRGLWLRRACAGADFRQLHGPQTRQRRVLAKLGMQPGRLLRRHRRKFGATEDSSSVASPKPSGKRLKRARTARDASHKQDGQPAATPLPAARAVAPRAIDPSVPRSIWVRRLATLTASSGPNCRA